MASPIQTLKEYITPDDGDISQVYLCHDCDNQFTSTKQPQRVQCPKCMSIDVEQLEPQRVRPTEPSQ